ncbi:NADPH-dependent FMN reductase [Paenibacillus sp. FSL H7-0737]|uniref:NADPH-dependent FMN reductase n=1 Tax=Paenibacillus sp. FSL H7-0737 TaxID=1536775 RepID=UPI0004F87586|nr:NADPH-dependent FMN reductase [Paenibacillus sp. FSL H7-0737]AIQ22031.1 FMN reductase [Paenibacillus sp. FSL H7-0737]
MSKAVIINGGNTRKSRLTAIHQQVGRFLEQEGIGHHSIYVHELPAIDLLTANFASEEILGANALVEEADIVVILTPIYKASYTGILKTYLDLLPQKALVDKRIVPIAIGGSLGHLLAIEYALKPVLSVLGATEIFNTVYFLDRQIERLEADGYRIDEEAEQRLNVELLKLAPAKIIN